MDILIVEDDFSFALEVEMLIDKLGYQHVGTVDNGIDALAAIANKKPDLVLMDIDINGQMSGLDVAGKINTKKIPIVFMTTFNDEQTYKAAMQTSPFGYIVKPFDEISLRNLIDRVFESENFNLSDVLQDCFFIKVNQKIKKIKFDEVFWIQSEGNYVDVHLQERRYTSKISLTKLEDQLKAKNFRRIHKRFIINMDKIDSISSGEVMINQNLIPIGKTYKDDLLSKLKII